MNLLPRDNWHSKFQKTVFNTSSLKVPSFIYLRLLTERLLRIKVKVLQNFEAFSIETFIDIHLFDDA